MVFLTGNSAARLTHTRQCRVHSVRAQPATWLGDVRDVANAHEPGKEENNSAKGYGAVTGKGGLPTATEGREYAHERP